MKMSETENMLEGMPHYVGEIHPNCDYHHGQIPPAKGVKCYQVARANRNYPQLADGTTSTYKHGADLAYFHGRFYIQYLCNPVDEHEERGYSVLASSDEKLQFDRFVISFPEYQIKKCTVTDYKGLTHTFSGETYAFMHQRMGFYRTSTNRMLVLGFYGWSPEKWMTNWDNYGIGRVVRELYPDGTLGDIYFIRPNWQAGWSEELLNYPMYTKSQDTSFVEACDELLSNRLYVQQWAEENGDQDSIIAIKHPGDGRTYQAFQWYHIDQETIIGMWKHSLVARSNDGGTTWSDVTFCPSLVMSGQKIWGEKLSDGTYALVYDPTLETQHRYPMCVVTSQDGIAFDRMRLVHGEVPMTRYAGFWKDFGPQYMRGMAEGITTSEDHPGKDMYVTYSVNKEDIWIARIPVPIEDETSKLGVESFDQPGTLDAWNVYAPVFARPQLVQTSQGGALRLMDEEPIDYCKVERMLLPEATKQLEMELCAMPAKGGALFVELCDSKAMPAIQLIFRDNGVLYVRTVTEIGVCFYTMGERCKVGIQLDCKRFGFTITFEQSSGSSEPIQKEYRFMSAVNEVSRLVLSTKTRRTLPNLFVDPDKLTDLPYEQSEVNIECSRYDLYQVVEL